MRSVDRIHETLTLQEVSDGVALVTFNRPDSLNAMSAHFVQDLKGALVAIDSDSTIDVVVLTGAGRGFCSGHDLREMDEVLPSNTTQQNFRSQETYADLVKQVQQLSQPVIAAVNGPAAGGGFALALAADTRICSEGARFNAAFVRLGLSGCDVGVSYLLPRIVGPTLAFEMMLTGRLIDSDEAVRSGLVLRVVAGEMLVPAAVMIADKMKANGSFALQMTKRAMWANLDAPSLAAAIELENRTQVVCLHTDEHRIALDAFLQGRFEE